MERENFVRASEQFRDFDVAHDHIQRLTALQDRRGRVSRIGDDVVVRAHFRPLRGQRLARTERPLNPSGDATSPDPSSRLMS
jgi:hypothetical protein